MVEKGFRQMDKHTLNKVSFYVNIVLFIVVALSVVLLILDSYNAGKLASSGTSGDQMFQQGIYLGRDIAFLSVSLALIFFQFFRNLRIIIQRSW